MSRTSGRYPSKTVKRKLESGREIEIPCCAHCEIEMPEVSPITLVAWEFGDKYSRKYTWTEGRYFCPPCRADRKLHDRYFIIPCSPDQSIKQVLLDLLMEIASPLENLALADLCDK